MKDWIELENAKRESRNKAQIKYDKQYTKGLYLKLNIKTDLDIIRWLWAQPSKQEL